MKYSPNYAYIVRPTATLSKCSCFVFEIISELKDTESIEVNYQREVKTLENLFMEELQPYGDKGYHEIPKKRNT